MRKFLVILSVVLASCGDPAEPMKGDATTPPPTDATDDCSINDPWSGTYKLSWTCSGGCESDAPYHYFDQLVVTDTVATYQRTTCLSCDEVDTVAVDGNCLVGNGIPLGGGVNSDPYEICADGCMATGDVSWTGFPGPRTLSTWTVVVTR